MKKISVINELTSQRYEAKMEDPANWIAECVANNWWGLPERELDYIPEGLDARVIKTETKTRINTLTGESEEYTAYTIKADYVITIEDITEEHNKTQAIIQAIQNGKNARLCCVDVYDYIAAKIDPYTSTQIDSFMSTYSDIIQLLQIYRPVAFKQALVSVTVNELLTQEMLDGVNAILTNYGF